MPSARGGWPIRQAAHGADSLLKQRQGLQNVQALVSAETNEFIAYREGVNRVRPFEVVHLHCCCDVSLLEGIADVFWRDMS